MPTVVYITHDGCSRTVEVSEGTSLMAGAVAHAIDGIVAVCGGTCSCGTCQIFVDHAWLALTGRRSADEVEMLEFAECPADNLRLACQIPMTKALDGIIVRIPKSQH